MKFPTIVIMCIGVIFLAVACNSSKSTSTPTSTPTVTNISGKIMVLLDRSVQPQKLTKDLPSYQLKNEGQISRSEYRFMFSFDANNVDTKKIIEDINNLYYASQATIPQQTNR